MNTYHHNAAAAGDKAIASAGGQKEWLCPYPHPVQIGMQPDSARREKHFVRFNDLDATCAAAECRQPLQFCPACGESNRSLARFCRACCQPLSFEEAVVKFQATHEIQAKKLIKEFRQVELPEIPGRALSALATGWGYLLVAAPGWGLGAYANTVLQPPQLLSRFETDNAETVTAFHKLRHAELTPGFLAIGGRYVYRLDFLPELHCKVLFHLPDPAWDIRGSLLTDTMLVMRAWHRESGWSRWVAVDCNTAQVQTLPFQQHGEMSEMIALSETGKLLFHTLTEIVELDTRAGIERRYAGPACGLNVKVRPQLFTRTGEIILCGLDGALYRLNLGEGKGSPEIFGRGRHELVHMFLNVYDDYLYLLCRDNLVLVDYPSGAAFWNSQQHAKTLIHCGKMAPQQWGNYLVFSLRSSATGGEERVALFSCDRRSSPLLLHPGAAHMPPPARGATSLIAARARQEKPDEPTTLLLFQL